MFSVITNDIQSVARKEIGVIMQGREPIMKAINRIISNRKLFIGWIK